MKTYEKKLTSFASVDLEFKPKHGLRIDLIPKNFLKSFTVNIYLWKKIVVKLVESKFIISFMKKPSPSSPMLIPLELL